MDFRQQYLSIQSRLLFFVRGKSEENPLGTDENGSYVHRSFCPYKG